jgi:hypothetical protein
MFHPVADFLRQERWDRWTLVQIETAILIWWIFRPGATAPEMIGKLPRTPRDITIARSEAAALDSLSPVAAQLNIPRLRFQADLHNGGFLFVQSGLAGRPLPEKADHFDRVLPWLDAFQQAVPPSGSLGDSLRHSIATTRTQLPDATPAERELLVRAESEATLLDSLPAYAVHGDFWCGNVLDDGGRLGVLDWSTYHFGSPLEDLHNFAAAQGYETHGGTEERMQSMWRVFFNDLPLMRRTAEMTSQMLTSRHIGKELLHPMFLLFLISRIGHVEFTNHAAWRRFAVQYLEAGMPQPFTVVK